MFDFPCWHFFLSLGALLTEHCVFLAEHMDVDKICFTGSSAVGHRIIQMSAASNMKRVTFVCNQQGN